MSDPALVDAEASPPILTDSDLAFREAAEVLGISLSTLKRRHKDGSIEEAVLRTGPGGEQWALATSDLGQVAERNGWVVNLDLRGSGHESTDDSTLPQVEVEAMVQARVESSRQKERLSDLERKLRRAESDLEHERAENSRITEELSRSKEDHASTRVDLGQAEAEALERLESLGVERGRVEVLEGRLLEVGERVGRAEAEAQALRDSLGWWAKRRLSRREGS